MTDLLSKSCYLSDNGAWLADAVTPNYIHLDQA